MRKYQINASIIQAIENLDNKAKTAVLFNKSIGDWFRLLLGFDKDANSPQLSLIYSLRESWGMHWKTTRIVSASKVGSSFPFPNDNVVNAEEEEEADNIVTSMDTTCARYKMEIGLEKTKIMTINPDGFQREIKIKGQRLEEVKSFKYLRSVISKEGSKPEKRCKIAQTTAARL